MKYQASLGNIGKDTRHDVKMEGYTAIGRILKVHHKHNTADVKLVRTNDVLSGLSNNEGRFSCKILVSNARFDINTGKSNGVIEPLTEGELVVLSFLEGMKSQPLIIGSLHRMDNTDNILTRVYPLSESNKRERLKYLRVFPSQDYVKVDGEGNIELALHGKSFIKVDDTGLSDEHQSFDFSMLSEKDKFTENTLTMEDSYYHKPKDILAVFRDNWNDSVSTWTKVFVKSDGMLRVTRDNRDSTCSYLQVSKQGELLVRRQNDSPIHGSGACYSQSVISPSGEITTERVTGDKTTRIVIHQDHGVLIEVSNQASIVIEPDGRVSIHTNNSIDINAKGTIDIGASGAINMNSSSLIKLTAPKVSIN